MNVAYRRPHGSCTAPALRRGDSTPAPTRRVIYKSGMMAMTFSPLLALLAAGCFWAPPVPPTQGPPNTLEVEVQDACQANEQIVTDYGPKVAGRIDDLAAPAADILRQLPGVADVEVLVAAVQGPRPEARHPTGLAELRGGQRPLGLRRRHD